MVCGCGACLPGRDDSIHRVSIRKAVESRRRFVRVTTPGQADLSLDPGGYTIFHEQGGMTDGTGAGVITAGDIAGLRISVQNPGTGMAVPLTASAGSRYTFDG